MKKHYLILLSTQIIFIQVSQSQSLTDEGLQIFWTLTEQLHKGEKVSNNSWQTLWDKPGFSSWMGSERSQNIFLNYYTLVHAPFFKDSLQKELENSQGYRLTMFEHMIEEKQKRSELRQFVKQLKSSNIIDEAKTIASAYLPDSLNLDDDSIKVALMIFQPDAFAVPDEGVILFDALFAYNYGKGLEYFLAHEFHHIYSGKYLSKLKKLEYEDKYYPLVWSIYKLMLEGTADLIDKADILEKTDKSANELEYVSHYHDSKIHLQKIDSLLQIISTNDSLVEDYGKQIRRELPYSAHPTGLYIAHLIEEHLGREAIISCLENPFIFLQLYNQIAKRFPSKYHVFSDKSMQYLWELEQQFIFP